MVFAWFLTATHKVLAVRNGFILKDTALGSQGIEAPKSQRNRNPNNEKKKKNKNNNKNKIHIRRK